MAKGDMEKLTTYESIMADNGSNYKVSIGGLGHTNNVTVTGILNAPMPIAGSNEFDSAKVALSQLPLFGKVFDIGNSISQILKISGNDTTMSVEQTRKIWQESKVPQLSVELTFWNIGSHFTKKDELPVNKVRAIYSALFPTKRDNLLVSAPLGYKFTNDKGDAVGTVTLRIGRWFFATGLVVVDANFTPSLEVTQDGSPLFYTGSVNLEPYKMITYQEFSGWFKTEPLLPIHGSTETPKRETSAIDDFVAGITKQGNDFLGQFKKIG